MNRPAHRLTRRLCGRGEQQAADERSTTEVQPSTSVRWHDRVPVVVEDRWKIRATDKIGKPPRLECGDVFVYSQCGLLSFARRRFEQEKPRNASE
jgi:hypothetical protein